MTNLRTVKKYGLPMWANAGYEAAGEFGFPQTLAFYGKDSDGLFAPTALGFNPFDENTALSTYGIHLQRTGKGGVIGELRTHAGFDYSSGMRIYEVTHLSSEGDLLVAAVLKPQRNPEDEYRDPDTVIFRELTDEEREYAKFLENGWVGPFGDQREKIAEIKTSERYKQSPDASNFGPL